MRFFIPDTRTMVEFKFTGIKTGSLKSQFLSSVTFYGGYKRDQNSKLGIQKTIKKSE